jgi:hypothetical protein
MKNTQMHDKGYKQFFSNPVILKELLGSFIKMDWVQKVDFSKND